MQFISDITVKSVQSMGGDLGVVLAARVSMQGPDSLGMNVVETEQAGLINYLIKHRHGTPFEHSAMTFFVHAPIFVWREWHRHRIGFSYNEESGRYKQLEPVFWVPRRNRKMVPSPTHKSARPDFVACTDDVQYERTLARMKDSYEHSYCNYEEMLQDGIAKEVARAVLPVATFSSCWVTCNPRSLMAFLSLRTKEDSAMFKSYPQAEIEEAARACERVFEVGWPLTYKAFCDNGRVAP